MLASLKLGLDRFLLHCSIFRGPGGGAPWQVAFCQRVQSALLLVPLCKNANLRADIGPSFSFAALHCEHRALSHCFCAEGKKIRLCRFENFGPLSLLRSTVLKTKENAPWMIQGALSSKRDQATLHLRHLRRLFPC